MRVYVVYGCVQWEDFEWVEGIYRTLKAARVRMKALRKQAVSDNRTGYCYRITKYEVQE